MKKIACTQILAATLCWAGTASATLIDRGNGMIYDSAQNLTWLKDTNYAKTSGYDSDGLMSWDDAMAWVQNLTYGGHDDWRLPRITYYQSFPSGSVVLGGGFTIGSFTTFTIDGAIDSVQDSPILDGGIGLITSEIWSAEAVMCHPFPGTLGAIFCQRPLSPFENITSEPFWYGIDDGNSAWASGSFLSLYPAALYPKSESFQAWAVRDGDVAGVPEPQSLALSILGLACMGYVLRKPASPRITAMDQP